MRPLVVLGALVLACTSAQEAIGEDKLVHVWMKAFIPSSHPTLSGYMKKTTKGTFVIEAPPIPGSSLKGTCFETDNREFSEDPSASARVSVDLLFKVSIKDMILQKSTVKIGESQNVDCKTGELLRPPKKASDDGVNVGSIKKNGFFRTIFVRAASANPFYGAPDIDYSFTLTFDATRQKLSIKGSTGIFPAYESYWQIDAGPVKPILKRPPQEKATAFDLVDAALGFNTINFDGSISLL
ncbi:DUF3238 domain-containing protein [Sinorhizobium meliloti]|uniref:DUF3238 domain-containing protein n=1 Tax=Rhizobium meliloti TaxID=382 RepID=UPI000B49701B|nr:DUF3238 domain-containing protein [Sinorhizobium meliloti]ASQ04092.1 DUF3238 domain-containing protein [Sinorhizobium meliloti]MDW9519685.1 DUF3238 domain-containing protein [Sinorhizobium meliloti]MDW9634148.1 DUF3238 domain-containing protein [Sinorhizobium meliloti]MDW9844641.1 DUF3238 domain-containing protein [Sinorhizobium meliloti]MDX0008828.1 DUF3238 domain-containing protein [Sinorhizobium meliloti]